MNSNRRAPKPKTPPAPDHICAHVDVTTVETPTGYVTHRTRCPYPNVAYDENGWLCVVHRDQVEKRLKGSFHRREDEDMNMVRSILHTEAKALRDGVTLRIPSCFKSRESIKVWYPNYESAPLDDLGL